MKARQIRVLFILLSALLLGMATYSLVMPGRAIAGCGIWANEETGRPRC
jgi:hypothetical protein